MSDNWVVQNLENALETWNEKLAEIWTLVTQSPQAFKGGSIWGVMVGINGAVQAVGLALIVLFFVMGVMKTCGSFSDLKRPEVAVKVFVRFALAKAAVTHGLELMNALFSIAQGLVSTIMSAAGFGSPQQAVLPTEIITAVEDCGFFESIPLWAVTLIGGLLITVLSFIRNGRIRHNGGGIGITEDHLIALLFQCQTGLCASIVELCGLADDNGTGTDDQYFMDICSLRHDRIPPFCG